MLQINGLTYRIGGRTLFDHATLTVAKGRKVGLVGRNGAGKTTLFRLITGEISPDDGEVSVLGRARVGTVAQEAPGGPESLLDTVLAADAELAALTAEAGTAADPNRIAEIHTRLADMDAHTAPARAAAILAGLGFDEAAQRRPCAEFSGGWRMRVALAGALFARPDLLLLDEPTNHLDLEATMWLESYLASWPGTLVVISHERTLLNQVAGGIVHLHGRKLTAYGGGYDTFEKTRRERLAREASLRAKQLAEQRRIQAFVDRFRAKATKARQAQSRLKMLARMEPIASVMEERTAAFEFPNPDPAPPPLITMDGVAVGYGGKAVLRDLDLRIDMEDRIALLGANGNGKSTLVKLLAGRLDCLEGEMRRPGKLNVGYFAQHQADELDLKATPLVLAARALPDAAETKVRAHLGRFGFGVDRAETTVADLSGGEKARLLFCLMSIEAPHILLLDEPTNHLDVDAREALAHALNAYEGAVVLVSHDPHLVEIVADELWLVEDGGCKRFDGDLGDYRRHLIERTRTAKRARNGDAPAISRRDERRARAQAREATAGLRKQAKEAEKRLARLGKQRAEIETVLADPATYEGSTADMLELSRKLVKIDNEIAAAESAWLEAEEALGR
ncbi:MAG: ABC-F family ATP-binding cassette domain-containing protein [Rhodospirillales bacterium]|nr:ABC-F family ATP-binding cassette domain-containing protein [Rhodospirillales bacterium]